MICVIYKKYIVGPSTVSLFGGTLLRNILSLEVILWSDAQHTQPTSPIDETDHEVREPFSLYQGWPNF